MVVRDRFWAALRVRAFLPTGRRSWKRTRLFLGTERWVCGFFMPIDGVDVVVVPIACSEIIEQ